MKTFPQIDKSQCKLIYRNYVCPWGGKQDIYLVPLEMLHLNIDNGRIATWVSGHESNPNVRRFEDMTLEEWNKTLIKFINESSSKDEYNRTYRSLYQDGQLKVGAILSDGTVVAGNRRCSILMTLLHDTGNYERFGYFQCAIFDVPNTEEGRKELKRLETKTQYGEDTPVAYGPIEKLVDIYTNVIAPGHAYSETEYQNYLGLKKSQMDNYVARAKILVDYLEYLGKPGNYEIARIEKLDGPINELAGLRKKVSDKEWERIKISFYNTLSNESGKKGDRTRIVRALIKIYYNTPEEFEKDLAQQDDDLLSNDAAAAGVNGTTSTSSTAQSRNDRIITNAMGIQIEAAKKKPLTYAENALDILVKLDKVAIAIMNDEDREEFFKRINSIIRIAQNFTKDNIQ